MKNFNKYKNFVNKLAKIKGYLEKSNCDKCHLYFSADEHKLSMISRYGFYGSSSAYDVEVIEPKDFYICVAHFLNINKEEFFKATEKYLKKEALKDLAKMEEQALKLQSNIAEIKGIEL